MNAVAWSVAHWRNVRGGDPRMSDTVAVTYAGSPIVADADQAYSQLRHGTDAVR